MNDEVTIYERKVRIAMQYLEMHNGDGQAARHDAAQNDEVIDSAEWREAEDRYEERS